MANRICIVGTGYVGMATMLGLAELGWAVNGFDIVGDRIARLRAGVAPYREAGIEELLAKHAAAGRLEFFDDVGAATEDCDVIVVAVGTPARDDGSADLSALHTAFGMLTGMAFRRYPSIVVRSTVPPGTCDELAAICVGRANVVYVPEFLREGTAVRDFLTPDRIVVGAASFEAAALYVELFERLQCPVLLTSRSNAELIKCGSNAFLALKISFANEVANLCEAVGATSDDVLRGIGYDRRIGSEFLNPGIGFGGPCFEKDVKSLDHVAKAAGSGRELFAATLRVNESQPKKIVDILERELGSLAGRTIGVWGLAFKA
ncbi:MAG: UDP-glucose dehydrogenase family protein, partial [Vulcanimicrobiaceae bacterium]